MLRSGSTHMPPTISQLPCLMSWAMRLFCGGYLSAIHVLYCAADCVKVYIGYSRINCAWVSYVRRTTSTVSVQGQVHAASMCELPVSWKVTCARDFETGVRSVFALLIDASKASCWPASRALTSISWMA